MSVCLTVPINHPSSLLFVYLCLSCSTSSHHAHLHPEIGLLKLELSSQYSPFHAILCVIMIIMVLSAPLQDGKVHFFIEQPKQLKIDKKTVTPSVRAPFEVPLLGAPMMGPFYFDGLL